MSPTAQALQSLINLPRKESNSAFSMVNHPKLLRFDSGCKDSNLQAIIELFSCESDLILSGELDLDKSHILARKGNEGVVSCGVDAIKTALKHREGLRYLFIVGFRFLELKLDDIALTRLFRSINLHLHKIDAVIHVG